MGKPRVYVTRTIPDVGLDRVLEACDAEVWEGETPPPHDVIVEKVQGCDGLLCLLTDPIDAEVIAAAGDRLKVISTYAVGIARINGVR